MSNSFWPHGLQHARLPCPPLTPGAYSSSCPPSQWCHPTTSSSVGPFSSHLQSFPASGSFPVSQFFASGDQSIGVSASVTVLSMNFQGWFPLGLTVFCFFFKYVVTGSVHKAAAFHTAQLCLDEKPEVRESHVPGLWILVYYAKLESRLPGEISITSDMQMTPPLWQKVKRD